MECKIPVLKDHLSIKTTFLVSLEWTDTGFVFKVILSVVMKTRQLKADIHWFFPSYSCRFVQWKAYRECSVLSPGGCFTKTKINFKLDLSMAGCSCHWLLSLLVSQLWSSYNILSFNNDSIKKCKFCKFVTMICMSLEKPMPGMV